MPNSQTIQSLERGLVILSLAVDSPNNSGVTLARIAEVLQVKTPTAHNLTRTLLKQGFLERTEGRPAHYIPGPTWRSLAERHLAPQKNLEAILEQGLTSLHLQLPELNVVIAQSRGVDVFTVLRYRAARQAVLEKDSNNWLAPYITASSQCFLGFWSPEKLRMFREQYPFEEFGAGYWGSEDAFEKALRKIRKNGCAIGGRDQGQAFRAAVPLFGHSGEILAALGTSEPQRDVLPDSAIPGVLTNLKSAAAEIQTQLNHLPRNPHNFSSISTNPHIDL